MWKIVTRLFLIFFLIFFFNFQPFAKGFELRAFLFNFYYFQFISYNFRSTFQWVFFQLFSPTNNQMKNRNERGKNLKNYPKTLYLFHSKAIVRCLNFNFQVNSIQSFLFTFWLFTGIIFIFFLLFFYLRCKKLRKISKVLNNYYIFRAKEDKNRSLNSLECGEQNRLNSSTFKWKLN